MILSDYVLSLLTALGTICAVIVALLIVVIPSIAQKRSRRTISNEIVRRHLKNLHELLRSFFFFNTTRHTLDSGEILYAYKTSLENLNIRIDATDSINNLYIALYDLKKKNILLLLSELRNFEEIFSGIPISYSAWIKCDKRLDFLRRKLFRDHCISIKESVESVYQKSIEMDKKNIEKLDILREEMKIIRKKR